MKNMTFLSVFILIAVLAASPAFSSSHKKGHSYAGHFGHIDTSGDDMVSWDEFKAHFSHAETKVFEEADGNDDELIDHDEWHEFKEKHGYGHGEGHHHD